MLTGAAPGSFAVPRKVDDGERFAHEFLLRGTSFISPGPAAIRQRREPAPQTSPFDGLPDGEHRQPDDKVSRALQQRDSERHLGGEAEGGTDEDVSSLLHTHSVRDRERDGADGVKQALYNEHSQKAERRAG